MLGSMDQEGNTLGRMRFKTEAETLKHQVVLLVKKRRRVHLTLEAVR
jgi:hypothetical protein